MMRTATAGAIHFLHKHCNYAGLSSLSFYFKRLSINLAELLFGFTRVKTLLKSLLINLDILDAMFYCNNKHFSVTEVKC